MFFLIDKIFVTDKCEKNCLRANALWVGPASPPLNIIGDLLFLDRCFLKCILHVYVGCQLIDLGYVLLKHVSSYGWQRKAGNDYTFSTMIPSLCIMNFHFHLYRMCINIDIHFGNRNRDVQWNCYA